MIGKINGRGIQVISIVAFPTYYNRNPRAKSFVKLLVHLKNGRKDFLQELDCYKTVDNKLVFLQGRSEITSLSMDKISARRGTHEFELENIRPF